LPSLSFLCFPEDVKREFFSNISTSSEESDRKIFPLLFSRAETIGAVRDVMKRFATSARLSHYWKIDDSVIGFVAGPERLHVSMREALLYEQRQMLHGRLEGVGICGFESWKGIANIRAENDLCLKATGVSIYKASLSSFCGSVLMFASV
jgi:hypothetical protein